MTIVNHKYKFIFIKTQKTAGTSMEISLSKFCNNKDTITLIKSSDEILRKKLKFQGPSNYAYLNTNYLFNFIGLWIFLRNLIKFIPFSKNLLKYKEKPVLEKFKFLAPWQKIKEHNTLENLKKKIPEYQFNNYYKFCIVRHPYDSMVSHYWWEVNKNAFDKNKSFFEFVKKESYAHFKMTYDIMFISGKLLFDKCVKYENFENDLKEVSNSINLPENIYDIFKNIKTKHTIRKDKTLNIIDNDSKEKIYHDWKIFFELFDYKKDY